MPVLINIIEQCIGIFGLILSFLIDGTIAARFLRFGMQTLDFDRIIRPISIFFVALLVCKVFVWTI